MRLITSFPASSRSTELTRNLDDWFGRDTTPLDRSPTSFVDSRIRSVFKTPPIPTAARRKDRRLTLHR